jgi:hypothetical protein
MTGETKRRIRRRRRLKKDREMLWRALSELVAKIDQVQNDDRYLRVFLVAALQGCPYDGPQYVEEMVKARAALVQTERPSRVTDGLNC